MRDGETIREYGSAYKYTSMAGADDKEDNAILAGEGGGARTCRYEENGVKVTNMVSTTYSKRKNGNVEGTVKGCVAGSIVLCQPVVAHANLCETMMILNKWTGGQRASTTTGVQLDYGLWPLLVGTPGYPAPLGISYTNERCVG